MSKTANKIESKVAKANDPNSAAAAYFAAHGVEVDMSVPDISGLEITQDNPCRWVDKDGKSPPADWEFFKVATEVGEAQYRHQLMYLTKPVRDGGPGWQIMPTELGLRWVSSNTDNQIVLGRSLETKRAYMMAQAELKRRRMNGAKITRSAPAEEGGITASLRLTEQHLAPALRD